MRLSERVVRLFEKIGAVKSEVIEGIILDIRELDKYEDADFYNLTDLLGTPLEIDTTNKNKPSFLVQTEKLYPLDGVIPFDLPSAEFFVGSEAQFKIYTKGWMPDILYHNPVDLILITRFETGKWHSTTGTSFYRGTIDIGTLKSP